MQLILLIALTFLSPLCLTSHAFGSGNEGAHAGDYLASEFQVQGQRIVAYLNSNPAAIQILGADRVTAISKAVRETPVNSVGEILRDPRSQDPVDALTVDDPKSPTGKSIRIQRQRWEQMFTSRVNISRLVLHEYLWAAGYDDTNFAVSGLLTTLPSSVTDTSDPLAGSIWVSTSTAAGINKTYYVLFDQHGNFRIIETLKDASNYGIRGHQHYGTYAFQNGQLTLQSLGTTCPLNNSQLGRSKGVFRYVNSILILDTETGNSSLFFTRTSNDAIASLGPIPWGCLSSMDTFTPYRGAQATARPYPAIPNNLPTPSTGDKFQAIAYSYSTGAFSSTRDQRHPFDAYQAATAACSKADCSVIVWAANSCIATSVADLEQKGWWSWGFSSKEAETVSLQTCQKNFGSCHLVTSVCPSNTAVTPNNDFSMPLVITDAGSVMHYNVYWTDQAGDKGNAAHNGSTVSRNLYLNPNRMSYFNLTGSVITFCYDQRLKGKIQVNATTTSITYCNL